MTRFFLLLLGPLLDVLTTYFGVFLLGLRELGHVPRFLFMHFGVLGLGVVFLYELGLSLLIYNALRRRFNSLAVAPAVAGPWYAGWHNIGVLVRVITG